jgi:hypothetical protein
MEFAGAGHHLVLNMPRLEPNKHESALKQGQPRRSQQTKPSVAGAVRLLIFSFAFLPFSKAVAFTPPEFKVSSDTKATPEGDDAHIMVIQTAREQFEMRVPKNYGSQVNQDEQSIVFTAITGSSVITVRMSTNYAGVLPKMEELREQVARKYATASLVQASPCHSSYATGLLFDLFQPATGNLTMRIRDGFISFPEGSFEFTLSCDLRDYDANRLSFAWLLNSFQLQEDPARKKT